MSVFNVHTELRFWLSFLLNKFSLLNLLAELVQELHQHGVSGGDLDIYVKVL